MPRSAVTWPAHRAAVHGRRHADPHTARRLGQARLTRFIWRYSHGHWGEELAAQLLGAAAETLALWDGELDYTELAADIAAEARLALSLSTEIRDLEQKIAALLHQADPAAIMTSVPGVGAINAARSWPASATRPGSAPWPEPAPSPAWSPPSPHPASADITGRHQVR